MEDHKSLPSGMTIGYDPSAPIRDPDTLNATQDKAMMQLGWEYQTNYCRPGSAIDIKRIYSLDKGGASKNQNLARQGFSQNLSLNFAAKYLEKQTAEY